VIALLHVSARSQPSSSSPLYMQKILQKQCGIHVSFAILRRYTDFYDTVNTY